jgi:hypothetical protein
VQMRLIDDRPGDLGLAVGGADLHPLERCRVTRSYLSLDDDPVATIHAPTVAPRRASGQTLPANHPGDSRESSRPSVAARVTAAEREWTPSFRYSSRVWVLTVLSDR